MFGNELIDLCAWYELVISDVTMLQYDYFTYVSDAHGLVSWLF